MLGHFGEVLGRRARQQRLILGGGVFVKPHFAADIGLNGDLAELPDLLLEDLGFGLLLDTAQHPYCLSLVIIELSSGR